jgi:hypothetical protein
MLAVAQDQEGWKDQGRPMTRSGHKQLDDDNCIGFLSQVIVKNPSIMSSFRTSVYIN